MVIANERTVIAQLPERLRKHGIVRYTHTRFAIGPQVFTEVETEAADIPHTASSLSPVGCTVGLRSILNDAQAVHTREIEHWLHIYRMAVQMNRHDSTRAGSQDLFKLSPIHRIRLWVDVYEDGRCTYERNRLNRRDECVGNGDDFITRANTTRT